MFTSALVVASLAASALATVYVTDPVAASSFAGGTTATISWEDDGNSPSLAAFGTAEVGIYVGDATQQTEVQQIVASVNVSTTSTIQFTVNPNAGQTGAYYFIRFQSLGLMDSTNPQFPAEAFSAKFTLTGMTGTFNAVESEQIAGASTAPIGGSSPTSAATGPTSVTGVTSPATTSSTEASSTGSSSSVPSTSPAANSAGRLSSKGVAGIIAFGVALIALGL